ncbi:Zinc finger, CHC2-type [Acididesulfobacillus acetoxydans]|uniref:Zinc finger, CHC2-type n=2 Tax=Acididesulfobacillus acetoxydans TaxID=1561005 RepID=A0A8S0WH59_9FIRM|nr:Zinc finger, CHC2-type [Acididesulfobacillus acetoxydans]CEJ05917.1 Zinc finger, CHC2-type [Acididesulfobacillus acetoxydans]
MGIISGNQDVFKLIREIPLREIFKRYSPNPLTLRAGKLWVVCPFHEDKNPSLSFKGDRFHCFGCGTSGDGVDFVAKLYGLTALEAARLIASDFGLAVERDKPLSREQRAEIRERQERRELERAWKQGVDSLFRMACDMRDNLLQMIKPETVDDETMELLINLEHLIDAIITEDDGKIFILLDGGGTYGTY